MSAVPLPTSRVSPLPLPGAKAAGAKRRRFDAAHRRDQNEQEPVYFVGPENRLVAAAIRQLIAAANEPARLVRDEPTGWESLTLIGSPGCGKSLLASGVASAWAVERSDDAVLSITGVDLRRQLERAFGLERDQPGVVDSLRDRLAEVSLLVVEGLEGIAASEPAVQLLSETFDRLLDAGGRLLITASRPLGEIAGLDTRFVSRLASGLTLEVAPPGEATRYELLNASLRADGCRIEHAAAVDLASWLPADARRVLAVAQQLAARFGQRTLIDRHRIKAFITEVTLDNNTTPLADIAAVVARYYAMPLRQLRSSSRKQPIVLARAVTIYLARQLTPLSYDDIGKYLGGRDHTTVMHNYNRIDKRLPKERALRSAIDELFRKLGRSDAIGGSSLTSEGSV